ncbi:MAG: ATP-binding cassette domain-containing protein [Oscillospiraceae bacterium]|nr:ATP-binding cassette domain-containing protein [Oscillospiraceae bacterium]
MIRVNGVSKIFDGVPALDGITLSVNDSSVYGLIGYNGAGKTTLLNLASGLYKPDGGKIEIDSSGGIRSPFNCPEAMREMFYVTDDFYFLPNCVLDDMSDSCQRIDNGVYGRYRGISYCRVS